MAILPAATDELHLIGGVPYLFRQCRKKGDKDAGNREMTIQIQNPAYRPDPKTKRLELLKNLK